MVPVGSFRYRGFATRLFAGDHALSNLAPEVDRLRAERVFVISGQSIATKTDLLDRVNDELGSRFAGVYDGLKTDSPAPVVTEAARAAEEAGADCIVAVGGGTAVVSARAIAMLVAEQMPIAEMATQYPPGQLPVSPKLLKPKMPIISVLTLPTTAMLRSGAAVKDMERLRRMELYDPKTRTASMIWDTDAVMTASTDVFLNTTLGFHGGSLRNLATLDPLPLPHADHMEVYRIAKEYVPRLVSEPDNPDVRMKLMAAGYMLNRASEYDALEDPSPNFSILGSAGASINTRYQCGQGPCGAVLGPATLRHSLQTAEAELAAAARQTGLAGPDASDADAARAVADETERFYRELGQPSQLRELGVPREDIPTIADDTMAHFFLRHDARTQPHREDLVRMLEEVW